MKRYEGDLTITKLNRDQFSDLEEVTGYLDVMADFQAPVLATVGGYLYVMADFQAPVLATVGGYLDVRADFQNKWGSFTPEKIVWPLVTPSGKHIIADGILHELVSERGPIYRTRDIITGKLGYLITNGDGKFAHGDTIKDARESLVYKIGNRDKSKFHGMTRNTVLTFAEGIEAYRVITGACASGTRAFVEAKIEKPNAKYTVGEIIELTNGQYGSEEFSAFFTGKKGE
jgi:hypothetical protein